MSTSFELKSRFQADGVFWDPHVPDETFPAHLSFEEHLEIIFASEVTDLQGLFSIRTREKGPDVLWGVLPHGRCTLIGLHELGNPANGFNASTGMAIMTRRQRINFCIMGCHVRNEEVTSIRSARCSFSGIDKWLPLIAHDFSLENDKITVGYSTKPSTVVDICALADRTRVHLKSMYHCNYGPEQFTARLEPTVEIEPNVPRSLSWFVEIASRVENLFSVLLGASVRLLALGFDTVEKEEGFVISRRRGKSQEPDVRTWIRCESQPLARAIARWLSAPDDFKPLENLVYGTMRSSSMFVETEFLTLAQALESFHRLTDRSTVLPTEQFAVIRLELEEHFKNKYPDSPVKERLVDGIQFANEPTLKMRINALLARITADGASKLIGDRVAFEQTLKQTRNTLTHPGIEPKAKVLKDSGELFLFNQKLHALLRLLILLDLGFSETDVLEPILTQATRWRLY